MLPPTLSGLVFEDATQFHSCGWSVIPLAGDYDVQNPKRCVLPSWREYQLRQPVAHELYTWFGSGLYQVMGVVLGRISGLLVVDIDSSEKDVEFREMFPDLVDTYVVRSGNRGLPHYYFQLEDGAGAKGCSTLGMDVRADGQYVVAPGSVIGGCKWEVVSQGPLRVLSERDLACLYGFVRTSAENGLNRVSACSDVASGGDGELSEGAVCRFYKRLASDIGRNNALFRVACFARDGGWSCVHTIKVLAPLHQFQPSVDRNLTESPISRHDEAVRTIRSAYTRAPRVISRYQGVVSKGLPNTVREWLCQHGMVNASRVLDGLVRSGVSGGDCLTAGEIYSKVRMYGIGRNTVYSVLGSEVLGKEKLFKVIAPPSPLQPPTSHANAAHSFAEDPKQCLFGRVAKPGKKRGRPAIVYMVPSFKRLCDLLGVENRGSDQVEDAALKSPSAYRARLHQALIDRAPKQYPRRWLSNRLGISKDTCRRYEKRLNIQVLPVFHRIRLFWHTIDRHIAEEPIAGRFLQDETGKRYPAIRGIARKLLGRSRQLTLISQDANFYTTEPAPEKTTQIAVAPETRKKATSWMYVDETDYSTVIVGGDLLPSTSEQQVGSCSMADRDIVPSDKCLMRVEDYKAVEPNSDSSVADHLYELLRRLNKDRSITRKLAKKWTAEYGPKKVMQAIRILQSRQNIKNPAGFIQTVLGGKSGGGASNVVKQSYEDWLKDFKKSEYRAYFENVDQVLEAY